MKRTKMLISSLIVFMLVMGFVTTCYAKCIGGGVINSDGSITPWTQQELDLMNAAAPIYTPEMEAMVAAGRPMDEVLSLCPNYGASNVMHNYLMRQHGAAIDDNGMFTPSKSVDVTAPVVINQADLLAALQKQGYTIDPVSGRVVPIPK